MAALLRVSVACSPAAGVADEIALTLPEGSTLLDALLASGLWAPEPDTDPAELRVGIWGARRTPETRLREGDRVEVYRPLQVDPMQARRLRQRRQAAEREAPRRRKPAEAG